MPEQRMREFPPDFFRSLNKREWKEFWASDGWIRGSALQRLWRLYDYQSQPPPQGIQVLINRKDVERLWPKKKQSTSPK